MYKKKLETALNKWNARKENKRKKRELRWVLKEIEWRKKEGYTYLVIDDYHFTPAEMIWLSENTGCKISEYDPLYDPGYLTIFEW